MSLILFLAFIFLLISHFSLRGRVEALERLWEQKGVPAAPPAPSYSSELTGVVTPMPAPAPVPMYPQGMGPDGSTRFIQWLQEDWLLKLGALLLLIGFGWFASYAFLNNWIGPMGRITLGLLFGAGFLAFGFFRLQKFQQQGSVFLVLGATVVLLTVFAARAVYGFFTPFTAMTLMFSASAFVALASVQYRIRSLAFTGLILAGIAPLLVRSTPDYIGLFSYLFMVVLGTLLLVVLRGWRDLLIAALTIITLYSLPLWLSTSGITLTDVKTLTYMSFGFVMAFFVFNLMSFLKGETGDEKEYTADLVSAVWIGAFLVPWIFVGIDRELQSLVLSAWAVLFASGAFISFIRTGNKKPLFAYAAVGIFLLGTATARELDGTALTIAFTLEAGALTFLSYMLLRDRTVAMKMSMLFAIPAFLSLGSIAKYPVYGGMRESMNYVDVPLPYMTPIFHEHFFVLFLLALTLTLLGCIFTALRTGNVESGNQATLSEVYLVVGSCYGYVLLWLSLHEAFSADSATMMALVLYTLIGLMAYMYGMKNDHRGLRIYGGILLGFVVGRLLLIEVWKMELTGRIITFFVIGTLLMSTAFFGKKKKEIDLIAPAPPAP